jgi:hypothetical protein
VFCNRRYANRAPQDPQPYGTSSELTKEKYYPSSSLQSPYDIKAADYLRSFERQGSREGAVDSYVHIWDRPLPSPQAETDQCPCNASDPPQYNLIGGPPPVEIYLPSEARTVYGNHTMARKEIGDEMDTPASRTY